MSDTTAIILATALGPLTAVLITLWHQDRKQKRDAKERVFIALMANRHTNPPTADWIRALNLIDVVYVGHPKILTAWHDLYNYVHQKPEMDLTLFEKKKTTLLSEIGDSLGYRDLKQTEIGSYYTPQLHADQAQLAESLQKELLRVLQATERLSVVTRKDPQT